MSKMLLHKLKQGDDLDGLSMVFSTGMAEWQKISDVPELRAEMRKMAEEEEAAEAALQNNQEQDQVYAVEDDESIAAASKEYFQQKKAKSFTTDDGTRYKWDDDEQDWVVGDDDEDEEDPDLPNNKRKHEDSSEDEEEVDEEAKPEGDAVSADPSKEKRKRKKKKKAKLPNTWVYVSGLPADVTFEEIKDHFSKVSTFCLPTTSIYLIVFMQVGLIALSPYDQQSRIKIYKEEDSDRCKGDCSICYNSEESVKLAVDILDGGFLRPNVQITVTKASFDNKADQPAQGPKKRITQAQLKVARNATKQALVWNEDDDIGVSKGAALRIIVLEGMFNPEELAHDAKLADDLEADIASECEKFGTIDKVTMFTQNPKGVVIIKFSTSFAAQECIRVMNGRFFAGSKIKCYFWDGVANFSVLPGSSSVQKMEEEEKQEASRLDEFGDWLEQEQEDLPEEFQLRTE